MKFGTALLIAVAICFTAVANGDDRRGRVSIPERDWMQQRRCNPVYRDSDLRGDTVRLPTKVWTYEPTPSYGTYWNLDAGRMQHGWHYRRSN